MSIYPYSQLITRSSHTVAVAGPHIQILDTKTGELVASTTKFSDKDKDAVLKSGPVLCTAIDPQSSHLITSGEDKKLKVWEIPSMRLLSERELPKRPTALRFTADGQTILAADKFGDVFSYSLAPSPVPPNQKADALASHENPSRGELILGHTSVLTDFVLSEDEQFIVTADRDEHIRVSWYPQGYNIESYCLGHERYVSAIHIPRALPSVLVSGGGDPVLKVWHWMDGKLLQEIAIGEAIDPFIKVIPPKWRRGWDGDQDEGGSKRKFRKGRKGKGKQKEGPQVEAESVDDDTMVKGEEDTEHREASANVEEFQASPQGEKTLVVHKIDSISDSSGTRLVFSAVGVSAIFAANLVTSAAATSPEIKFFDFGVPVIDFEITETNDIWVTLDSEWSRKEGSLIEAERGPVRVLTIPAGELIESTAATPLLHGLNKHSIVPGKNSGASPGGPPTDAYIASQDALKKLDLYSDLLSMPKHSDVEGNPVDRDISEVQPDAQSSSAGVGGKQRSKKEVGRLKSKKAVAQVLAKSTSTGTPSAPGANDEIPDAKRTKSEQRENDIRCRRIRDD